MESAFEVNEDNVDEVIYNIAKVSNNNDRRLGEIIAEIYKKTGSDVSISTSDKKQISDHEYEIIPGFNFLNSLMDWPLPFASPGSLAPPKRTSIITKMMMSSGAPSPITPAR